MVRQDIEARGIRNTLVLDAMRSTPRHLFVPPPYRFMAYQDYPLPIGYGQTISQPYIVALMTELLEPKPGDRILEIGTGSGYQAAVLARIVREVYTIEIVPELAQNASELLTQLGILNVFVRQGDGYQGWPEKCPFDGIILTAAPPKIPKLLTDELKPGGKLVAPVGDYLQRLVVIHKRGDGSLESPGSFRANGSSATRDGTRFARRTIMVRSPVAVWKKTRGTVVDNYKRLMRSAEYRRFWMCCTLRRNAEAG